MSIQRASCGSAFHVLDVAFRTHDVNLFVGSHTCYAGIREGPSCWWNVEGKLHSLHDPLTLATY